MTIVFLFMFSQSYIRLEIEDCNVDSNAVDHKMSRAYSRIRSNLYRKHYKKHFKGVKESDEVAMAIAKAAGREEKVDGIDPNDWSLICDSYDRDEWKVNIYIYIQLRLIRFA